MNVHVKDGLAAVTVRVYYNAIPIVGKSFFTRYRGAREQKMPEQFLVICRGFVQRIDMLSRHDQHMCRGLRTDVVQRNTSIILKNGR